MKRLQFIVGLAALLLAASAHSEERIPVDRYIGALDRIHAALSTGDLLTAKSEAAALTDVDVVTTRGDFRADPSLLAAIADSRGPDPLLLRRIELTLTELRSTASETMEAADPKLLQQVASEQEIPELARGGDLTPPELPSMPLFERVIRSIVEGIQWMWEKIGELVDWLLGFLPGRSGERAGSTAGMRWIVIAVVILIVIVLVVLAIEVVRRARRGSPDAVTSTAPARSTRDDDPLSRGAGEWEHYAGQLAADGRFREAIRAWYHAVLVTCYATGALHFRKGRTNWEYIASLPPSATWRSELIRLTQRFEQQWYGADQSTQETLSECSESARHILDELHRRENERGAA